MSENKLYGNMIDTQNAYRDAFVAFDSAVKEFFKPCCDEETSRIYVNEYNFVIVRVVDPIEPDMLERFTDEFDAKLMWDKGESVTDFSNEEAVTATVYEYGFAPQSVMGEKNEE